MTEEIRRGIIPSIVIHAAVVAVIFALVGFSLRSSNRKTSEIETDVSGPAAAENKPAAAEPATPQPKESAPAVKAEQKKAEPAQPAPSKTEVPTAKPKKAEITISQKKVVKEPDAPKKAVEQKPVAAPQPQPRNNDSKPTDSFASKTPISREEIIRRQMMNSGAAAVPNENPPVSSDETNRCLAQIRKQIHDAWVRPDSEAITGTAPVVAITLGPGGVVQGAELRNSSGNRELDDSVRSAVLAVAKFEHLSEAFIRANKTVTVNFELK